MSVREIREGIRAWLSDMVRIDAWDLDVPRNVPRVIDGVKFPANTAVEMPIKDFSLIRQDNYVQANGRFVYALLYRFSGKAAKHQLPMSSVENLIHFLSEYAVNNPRALADSVMDLQVSTANPVAIARVEGEDKDWLVIGRLEMEIRWISDAIEFAGSGLQPGSLTALPNPITINEIRMGLFRAHFPVNPNDPDTFVKDQELSLDLTLEGMGESGLLGDGSEGLGFD